MRTHHWGLIVLACAGVLGYFGVKAWNRVAAETVRTEALTADLSAAAEEIDREIAATPDTPVAGDVERMSRLNRKARALVERTKDVPTGPRGDADEKFAAARDRFLQALDRLAAKMIAMHQKVEDATRGGVK
jgi:hypothetical protein